MRLAVLADVHANLPALDAVCAALERERVDGVVHAGDLVGYGPWPNECVARIGALDAAGVAGNHDLLALGRLADDRLPPPLRAMLAWTRATLSDGTRETLATLPPRLDLPGLAVAHGTLTDPEVYVRTRATAREQLAALDGDLLVLGHTHRAWACSDGHAVAFPRGGELDLGAGRWLLNPGSVGQSRDRLPLARFLVLDTGARTASFRAVPFDLDRCRRELRRRGLPASGCHAPPRRLRALARRLRR